VCDTGTYLSAYRFDTASVSVRRDGRDCVAVHPVTPPTAGVALADAPPGVASASSPAPSAAALRMLDDLHDAVSVRLRNARLSQRARLKMLRMIQSHMALEAVARGAAPKKQKRRQVSDED